MENYLFVAIYDGDGSDQSESVSNSGTLDVWRWKFHIGSGQDHSI